MSLITIDPNKCKACRICVQTCPIAIIDEDPADRLPFVSAEKEAFCVLCGHCEAVCPEGALVHSQLQGEDLASPDALGIKQDQLAAYFRSRRSIRNYSRKPVDKKVLQEVMDVVRYAPTGVNRQMNRWVIVYDKKMVQQLVEGTINWMRTMVSSNPDLSKRLNMPRLIAGFEGGADVICRNAPHLAICYTDAQNVSGAKDAAIAAAHLELLLPSFGLGACWAGYLMVALMYSAELKALIGLDDSMAVHAALLLGYPSFAYYKVPQRKEVDVQWI